MKKQPADTSKIALFKGSRIRRTLHQREWWFVIVDVVEALTDSTNPKQYIKNMLNRDEELAKGWVQIEHPLLIDTTGGKQKIRCANTEGIFRIIQSIPSAKAEPSNRSEFCNAFIITSTFDKKECCLYGCDRNSKDNTFYQGLI